MKSQRTAIQYNLKFEVEPDLQTHSGCGLKLGGLKVGVTAPVKEPPFQISSPATRFCSKALQH